MPKHPHHLTVTLGAERFPARLRQELAPCSCEWLQGWLPYAGKAIHSRWSGEAMWSPLGAAVSADLRLPPEHATAEPVPGEILLYAGEVSEPELLLVYGVSRFGCKAGPLAGNPVLIIEQRLDRLAALGRDVLWGGAMEFRIEVNP